MPKLPEAIKPEKYYNKTAIIKATALQVQKDFEVYNYEINLNEQKFDPFKSLIKQTQPLVEDLLKHNPEKFFATLYRIDLKESTVNAFINVEQTQNNIYTLTVAILKREMEKVLIRKWYAGEL